MAIGEHIKDHEILQVKNKKYNDTRYVNVTGDTMTGTLRASPVTGDAIIIKSGKKFIYDGS